MEEQDEIIEVTDGIVARAQLSNIDRVQSTNVARALPDETERDICPGQQDDDGGPSQSIGLAKNKDSGTDSEIKVESILSPTAAPFCPRNREVTKERFLGNARETEVVNSLDSNDDNYGEVPSEEDASGMCYTASGQTEMGASNKTGPTDQEVINGRSEVESINSSSNVDKCIEVPSNNGVAAQVVKAKRGRPKKGSRVPVRRSERMWK